MKIVDLVKFWTATAMEHMHAAALHPEGSEIRKHNEDAADYCMRRAREIHEMPPTCQRIKVAA